MRQLLLLALSLSLATAGAMTPPPSVDREVAEWAIRLGGAVMTAGGTERIRRLERLPSEDFRIEELNLVGCNVDPPDLYRYSLRGSLGASDLTRPYGHLFGGRRPDVLTAALRYDKLLVRHAFMREYLRRLARVDFALAKSGAAEADARRQTIKNAAE